MRVIVKVLPTWIRYIVALSVLSLFKGSRAKIWTSPSLVAQRIKKLPAIQETQVQSLGQEDPLEKGMAAYSSILARRIPWAEEPGGLQSMGLQRVGNN